MKLLTFPLMALLVAACAGKKRAESPEFQKEDVCAELSLNYLAKPQNRNRKFLQSTELVNELNKVRPGMQACYDQLKKRLKKDPEFSACLVVGVDSSRKVEFFHFSSKHKHADDQFISCGAAVTGGVPYSTLGANYLLFQSFDFYKD
jgi:hypothetical protein